MKKESDTKLLHCSHCQKEVKIAYYPKLKVVVCKECNYIIDGGPYGIIRSSEWKAGRHSL